MADMERSRAARAAAEAALVGVIHHYGQRPEFVVLGGLVPELLCSNSEWLHAGTTDIDVHVDLEVAAGSIKAQRLETALMSAGFRADNERVWRWVSTVKGTPAVVKFELLTDQPDIPNNATVHFAGCDNLGAANLRGTGFASRDVEVRRITGVVDGVEHTVEVNVTGTAGFLLAKVAAARTRRAPKDWYDIAFVLLHNDLGGPIGAGQAIVERFGGDLIGETRSALTDLQGNFATPFDQGPSAYAEQMSLDNPTTSAETSAADAVTALEMFLKELQL
ncbi:MAG: hypothetical protein ACKN9D_02245 [Actinomycetales bacterium]